MLKHVRAPYLLVLALLLASCGDVGTPATLESAARGVLRTPEVRFEGLTDLPFEPNYLRIPFAEGKEGERRFLRVHYLDEGPKDGEVVLLMHGEPSWSYLYREIIPPLTAAGYRVLAPDLPGFGRSDKPARRDDYTYAGLVDWMEAWLLSLELGDVTLVAQDWGGLIGLRLVAASPERFARVVAANTALPTGEADDPLTTNEAFADWVEASQTMPELEVGLLLQGGTVTTLTPEEVAAYDAPFPDERYKAGARELPLLVPLEPDLPAAQDNQEAWLVLETFGKPFLTAFSDQDPLLRGWDEVFQERVPGADGQNHVTLTGGGHFLQEDVPAELTDVILGFMAANPLP